MISSRVTVLGEAREVALDGRALTIDGRAAEADVECLGEARYSVVIDGAQHTVHVSSRGDGDYEATVNGARIPIHWPDARRLPKDRGSAAATGSQDIRVPMPGRVLAVHVKEGDRVERGQGLLVVEAMKMQNVLRAPRDGVVTSLRMASGDTVGAGATLATIA